MSHILRIQNLKVSFRTQKGDLVGADNISLECKKGETLTILGESGCGKSMIAKVIMNILEGNVQIKGQIFFRDNDILRLPQNELNKLRGNTISMIMQNPDLALNPVIRVEKQLAESLLLHSRISKNEAKKRVIDMVEKMGFHDVKSLLNRYPHQLSGGMKQRLLIIAAILTDPQIIIADEPTKGLDETNRKLVINELEKVKNLNQSSLLLITHDIKLAEQIADHIAVMYAGEIIEVSQAEKFFNHPGHPYSRALLNSSPEKGFQPIPGQSPSLDQCPPGCRFHPRCEYKKNSCIKKRLKMAKTKYGKVKCVLHY